MTATAAGGFFAGEGLPTATGGGLGGGLFSSTPGWRRSPAALRGLGSTSATGDASFSAGLSAAPSSAAATGGHHFFGGMPATSAFSGLPSTLPTAKTAPAPRLSGLSPAEMNDSIAPNRQAQFSRRQAHGRCENRGFRVGKGNRLRSRASIAVYHRRPTQPPSHMAAYGAHRGGDRSNDGTDSELSSIPSTRDTSPGAGASGSHHHTDSYIGKALFDFKPQEAVEVELHAGDLVHIFPGITCAQGWCVVTNRGATGLVPLSYVTRSTRTEGRAAAGAAARRQQPAARPAAATRGTSRARSSRR